MPVFVTPLLAEEAVSHGGLLTKMFLSIANVGAEWVLWVLLILSFISVAMIINRILYFYRHQIDAEQLAKDLAERLHAGDVRGAWNLVAERQSIECSVVAAGLLALSRGSHACSEAMASAKAAERRFLDKSLNVLGTIGSNAPFVGLMGTVLGIIKAAKDLGAGQDGSADPNAVMAGVFEALVATAVGLFVAIPAIVAFNFLQRKVRDTLASVDSLAHLVLANIRPERAPPTAQPVKVS